MGPALFFTVVAVVVVWRCPHTAPPPPPPPSSTPPQRDGPAAAAAGPVCVGSAALFTEVHSHCGRPGGGRPTGTGRSLSLVSEWCTAAAWSLYGSPTCRPLHGEARWRRVEVKNELL